MSDASVEAGPRCIACQRDEAATPLVALQYRGQALWICPQHLPILIHDPARLVGLLPGAEDLKPADHHD
jgi:hypothetical protein